MMIKLYQYLFFTLIVVFISCNSDSYKTASSGIKYRVLEESDSDEKINTGDYVELEMGIYTYKDSLLFHTKEFGGSLKMLVDKPSHSGGCFEDALTLLNPGDRYIFRIHVDSFYHQTKKSEIPSGVEKSTDLYFNIKIKRKVSQEEINKERKLYEKKMIEQETTILEQFILDKNIKAQPSETGLYTIVETTGKGKTVKEGDIVSVHYIGKLIDGKTFDSSYERDEPFVFKIGANEAIKGWDEALLGINIGTKAKLIIPSSLAYGKEGYLNIIPPYSTLIFEIELIEILNN